MASPKNPQLNAAEYTARAVENRRAERERLRRKYTPGARSNAEPPPPPPKEQKP